MKFRKYQAFDSEKVGKYKYKKVDPGDRVTYLWKLLINQSYL